MLALDSKVQTTSKHVCHAVRRSVIDNNARASSVVNGGRCISGVSALRAVVLIAEGTLSLPARDWD